MRSQVSGAEALLRGEGALAGERTEGGDDLGAPVKVRLLGRCDAILGITEFRLPGTVIEQRLP